jgi:hypothetical protein
MRIDRRCWARAIILGECIWGFKGIANPQERALRYMLQDLPKSKRRGSLPMQFVLADESFMENLHREEAKYVATCDDYRDEWEEYVKKLKHREGCCPHGPEEERAAYQRVVASMTNCADKRLEWANEFVDSDWIHDSVSRFFEDEESLFYFVDKYPVDSVWQKYHDKWLSLDEVCGFCPSCNEPLSEESRWKPKDSDAHFFDPNCLLEVCNSGHSLCLFNTRGNPRDLFECSSCSWSDVTQDVEGDETFVSKHGRPFNWPPGAPYPPRCSFSGVPMNVPPYED